MATGPILTGAIDCDIHPSVPSVQALMPYLEDHWREQVIIRGIDELNTISYPLNSPLTCRADWRPAQGRPASTVEMVRAQALDPFGTSIAIANCLYGVQLLFSEDMAAAFARAVNDWMAKEWLDREPRLRASIVVPIQNAEMAVDEIERCAKDKRFVQVLLLVMGDTPLGGGTTGRSMPRPSGMAWPWASMPAAPTTTRRRRWAGPATTPRTTWARRRPSRPS